MGCESPTWIFELLGVGATPESSVRAGKLGLPLMVAIIGGELKRFRPLNGYAGSANERRNCLYNLLVFIHLLLRAEFLAGRNEFPNFRIFGNESWIGCLAVDVPDQFPDLSSLLRITTIHQDFCFWPSCC